MGQGLGQRAVVGHQQQAVGVVIQAPDGVKARQCAAQQIRHRRPALLVAEGGDDAAGLVEHNICMLRRKAQRHAVHADAVPLRVCALPQACREVVYRHAPGENQLFSAPAGRDMRRRDQFLQPFRHDVPPLASFSFPLRPLIAGNLRKIEKSPCDSPHPRHCEEQRREAIPLGHL